MPELVIERAYTKQPRVRLTHVKLILDGKDLSFYNAPHAETYSEAELELSTIVKVAELLGKALKVGVKTVDVILQLQQVVPEILPVIPKVVD